MKKNIVSILICFMVSPLCYSQEIYKHISYTSIYDYLDELANIHVIELNSAIKPYSRKFISEKLRGVDTLSVKLTKRQKKDLKFFLKDYNKEFFSNKKFKKRLDLFYYRDSLFSFTLNPILGYSYFQNERGTASQRWNGGEAYGYIGSHFGFYFSLRDNGIENVLAAPNYLTQLAGGNYKPYQGTKNQRTDFDESRGSVSYGWKWGSLSLVKDNFMWGNNYNGANIFSGRQPSFAYLSFKMKPAKWIEFNYIHGSLISQVLDSSKTYGMGSSIRRSFFPKYMAANMVTIRPCRNFYVSFGNSIVYADKYIQPIYLIPFMFYPSADHTMTGAGSNSLGENSQMFLDISLRCIPKTHIYSSLFIDEVNIGKMLDPAKQTNLFSLKAGIRFTNLLLKNTSFTFEYTRTHPWVYVHPIATTVFSSNNYNMGHYLGQNAEELYGGVKYKPLRGLTLDAGLTIASKGPELPFILVNGVNSGVAGAGTLKTVEWVNQTASLGARYEVINDLFVFASYNISMINGRALPLYTPVFYQGNTSTINVGINAGF